GQPQLGTDHPGLTARASARFRPHTPAPRPQATGEQDDAHGDQAVTSARRRFHWSNATASSSTTPLTTDCSCIGKPSSDMMLLITAISRPPIIAPPTRPMPPVVEAPPMKQAAIASSSTPLPAPGWAAFIRDE